MSQTNTHFIFRVSKNPCDDATEYFMGQGKWSFQKDHALLMPESEASDNCSSYNTDMMSAGCGTFTDDHYVEQP